MEELLLLNPMAYMYHIRYAEILYTMGSGERGGNGGDVITPILTLLSTLLVTTLVLLCITWASVDRVSYLTSDGTPLYTEYNACMIGSCSTLHPELNSFMHAIEPVMNHMDHAYAGTKEVR